MIKIIKKGTRDIRECKTCGCLFSFDEEDVESVFKNGRIDYKCVKCPQCSYKVMLEQEETIAVDQEKTLYEQGLPSCWTCDYYDLDFGICNVVIGKHIGLAENTCCTNYKEK